MLKRVLVLAILPLLLSACSKNTGEEIVFSSWGSITETKILTGIIKDFEDENPKIKVNFLHIPQNYFQKIHLLFASNQEPDVIFINNLNLPVYASRLENLDNLIDKSEFYPQSIDALSYEGHLYAIPRDISNLVFFCNKELLNVKNKDWKFSDFQKELQKYNRPNSWVIGFEPDVYYAIPYVMVFGGKITDEYSEGLNFYKNLEGKYSPSRSEVGSSTLAQMFLDKKIALYLSGRWMYPKITEKADFAWEILPFPETTSLDASGWAISKTSKHKEAAEKFVKFLASKESADYFAQTRLLVPARKNSAKILDNEKERVFLDSIENSRKTPVTKDYKRITDRINKEL